MIRMLTGSRRARFRMGRARARRAGLTLGRVLKKAKGIVTPLVKKGLVI
jgi:hypothetical protein